MPVYEYECADCGGFTTAGRLVDYRDPQPCPGCATPSPRAMLTPPAFAGMAEATRLAHATNERSAHEPQTSSQRLRGTDRSQHGAGCSCCSGGRKSRLLETVDRKKSFPDKRPWMISH